MNYKIIALYILLISIFSLALLWVNSEAETSPEKWQQWTKKCKELESVEGCEWSPSQGHSTAFGSTSSLEAIELAKNEARADAIANVTGIAIKKDLWEKDFEIIAKSLSASVQGVVIKERKIKDEDWIEEKGERLGEEHFTLYYCGCVKIEEEVHRDDSFKVALKISPRRDFLDGEEGYFEVHCDNDCYITIFDIKGEGKVSVLVPNRLMKAKKLEGGKDYEFPPPLLRKVKNFKFNLESGKSEEKGVAFIVATKREVNFKKKLCEKKKGMDGCEEKDVDFDLEDLLSILAGIKLDKRAEDVQPYRIKAE